MLEYSTVFTTGGKKTYLIDAACWIGFGALFSEDTLLFFTLSDFRIYRDEHLEEYFL